MRCISCQSEHVIMLGNINDPISCFLCASALCRICYVKSIKLFGYIGDKNFFFTHRIPINSVCMTWPYYPTNYGSYRMSRSCIYCGPRG